jgi:hypothetical protein
VSRGGKVVEPWRCLGLGAPRSACSLFGNSVSQLGVARLLFRVQLTLRLKHDNVDLSAFNTTQGGRAVPDIFFKYTSQDRSTNGAKRNETRQRAMSVTGYIEFWGLFAIQVGLGRWMR